MKKIALIFCLAALSSAVAAQSEIMLHLAPRIGGKPFALGAAFTHPGGAYQAKFTRFEYYITGITITHDGGQETELPDAVILARPALDSVYSLGIVPGVEAIEGISFAVGVEQARNHADPASYPAGHPLAPQNPEMHWGWSAGYRFAAIEGDAGTNFSQHFEVHALGDANYKFAALTTAAEEIAPNMKMIHLVADYSQALKSINVSGGLVVHGTSGAAVTLLTNFKSSVFKAAASSATLDPAFAGAFALWPNPVATGAAAQANFSLPAGHDYELTVTDLAGKIVARRALAAGENQSLALESLPSAGVFFVQLWQNARPVAVEKLITTR